MATACVQDLPPFSPLLLEDVETCGSRCPDSTDAAKPTESGAKKGSKRRDRSKRSAGGDVAGRRLRINFSAQQQSTLEAMFAQNRYPDADTRDRLAQSLGVAESRVIVWFQNKRARSRRQDKGRLAPPTSSNPPAYPPMPDKSPDQTYPYPESYSQSCPTMYASCALQRPKTVHHFPANPSCNLAAAPSQSHRWASSRPTSDVTATTWSTLTVSSAGRFYDCQPTQFRGRQLSSSLSAIEENGSDDEVKDFGAMHDESRARISIPTLQGPRIRAPLAALSTLNFSTVKELAIQVPHPGGAGPYSPISEPDDSLAALEAFRPRSAASTPTSDLSEPVDFASLPSPAALVDMYDVVDELKDFLTQYPLF